MASLFTRKRLGWALGPAIAVAALSLGNPFALAAKPGTTKVSGKAIGKLLNPVWNEAKDPKARRYTFREPSPTVRSDVWVLTANLPRELAIVAFSTSVPAEKQDELTVTIGGGRTSTVTIVVPENRAINFVNTDPFKHRLYEVSGKGKMPENGVEIDASGKAKWTPPGVGKWEIRDKLTPSLRTWVVVEKNIVAVAAPDRKGEFSLDLPAGAYTIRGYHAGEPVGTEMAVEVKAVPAVQPLKDPLKVGEVPAPEKPGGEAK